MKYKFLTVILLPIFFLTGCSDSDKSTASNGNCSTLMVALMEQEEAFGVAMVAAMTGGEMDTEVCTSYAASAQALVDAGCTMCSADDEACEDDGSNDDDCCDEIDQTGIDELSAMCGG